MAVTVRYTNTCCPEQADVTVQETTVELDGIAAYFREYTTADSGITLDTTRTVIILPTVPIDDAALHVFDNGLELTGGLHYTLSGNAITFAGAIGAGHQIDVKFLSTTPGSEQNAISVGTILMRPISVAVTDGYLDCTGGNVSRTTYAALFSVIGTTFGVGDGSTTFTLPTIADTATHQFMIKY